MLLTGYDLPVTVTIYRLVVILSGDEKQSPLVLTRNMHLTKQEEKNFLNPFAPQLEMTLANGMVYAQALPLHRLRTSYRSIGNVSQFKSKTFHDGEMIEGRQKILDEEFDTDPLGITINRNRKFGQVITTPNARGSSFMIDIDGDHERKVGTSHSKGIVHDGLAPEEMVEDMLSVGLRLRLGRDLA
ncbi:hypothetical protein FHL15_010472 [Xylaria flabelliformis]|uniref:Uncharacterized protein n=1 Tax=Xylaria flabelliformis TaxID=2512241 RepID=A0A553HKZ2_9PEZI|nr:hypothetical protein FHL15_010472 [Xylaria flabelliformis]